MKLIVHGYTGRMGQIVSDLAANGYNGAQLAARVGRSCPAPGQDGCYAALSQYDGPADCVVDFSSHLATGELLGYCLERRLPLVIAATGHTEAERALIEEAAGRIPIFFSANMSIGIALLARMAQKAAAVFLLFEVDTDRVGGQQFLYALRPFDKTHGTRVEIVLRSDVLRLVDALQTITIEMINQFGGSVRTIFIDD